MINSLRHTNRIIALWSVSRKKVNERNVHVGYYQCLFCCFSFFVNLFSRWFVHKINFFQIHNSFRTKWWRDDSIWMNFSTNLKCWIINKSIKMLFHEMEHFAETTNATSQWQTSQSHRANEMSMSINKLNELEAQKKKIFGNDSIGGNFVSSSMQSKRSSTIIITKRMNW